MEDFFLRHTHPFIITTLRPMAWVKCLQFTVLLTFLIHVCPAHAALDIMLTQGISSALPIAIVPFAGQDNVTPSDSLDTIISNDLQASGQFRTQPSASISQFPHQPSEVNENYWRKLGVENIVIGNTASTSDGREKVSFYLMDIFKSNDSPSPIPNNQNQIYSKDFVVAKNELHPLAHHISDLVYQHLTGQKGAFSTQIAFVVTQKPADKPRRYLLEVSDIDGYNATPLLSSREPIMSPAWSHDGKRIAYVSFEGKQSQIFIEDVASGSRRMISNSPGINGAPAWSPNDKKLALVLSKEGTAKIFIMDLNNSSNPQQVTFGPSIDTEPSWSPDGSSIIFTSDRGGSPQIYQLNLGQNSAPTCLSFSGDYNARATFTPDGKSIVMLHRENGMYNVAIQELETSNTLVLTDSGKVGSPSVAPNGSMIIYGTEDGKLEIVSSDGRGKLKLSTPWGKAQDPAWSYF
jgi:TolB protein